MKNFKLLPAIIVLAVLTFSCQKDTTLKPKETETPRSDFEVARELLVPFAQAAMKLSENPETKELVINEVAKRFDGDYNTLFSTLTHDQNNNARIASVLTQDDEDAMTVAIQKLAEAAGEEIFPQIYIPYFETLEEQGESASARLANSTTSPIVVIYDGDETQTEWIGYRLNDLGEFEDVGFPITVDYAENNEVWVVSINERIGSEIIDPDYDGIYAGARVDGITQRVRFNNITVHCRKESGLSGKTDLSIIRLTTWYDTKNPDTGNTEWYCHGECTDVGNIDRTGTVFKQWAKKEIGDQKTVNWRFWDKSSDYGDYMCFVLFEKDGWPAGTIRTQKFHPTGSTTATGSKEVEYRSSDKAYAYVNMYYDYGQSIFDRDFAFQSLGYVYDRCIEFNTQFD